MVWHGFVHNILNWERTTMITHKVVQRARLYNWLKTLEIIARINEKFTVADLEGVRGVQTKTLLGQNYFIFMGNFMKN